MFKKLLISFRSSTLGFGNVETETVPKLQEMNQNQEQYGSFESIPLTPRPRTRTPSPVWKHATLVEQRLITPFHSPWVKQQFPQSQPRYETRHGMDMVIFGGIN